MEYYITVGNTRYPKKYIEQLIKENESQLMPHIKALPEELQLEILQNLPQYPRISQYHHLHKSSYLDHFCNLPISKKELLDYTSDNIVAFHVTNRYFSFYNFRYDLKLYLQFIFEYVNNKIVFRSQKYDNAKAMLNNMDYNFLDIKTTFDILKKRHNCQSYLRDKLLSRYEPFKNDIIVTNKEELFYTFVKTIIYIIDNERVHNRKIHYRSNQFKDDIRKLNKSALDVIKKDYDVKYDMFVDLVNMIL